MGGILAVDTSGDACSVALCLDGEHPRELYEVVPRQHNRIIFDMLAELVPDGDLRALGVDCLAYGAGPGSFTGLRIAASAVQGLAYSNDVPVVAVSTLAIQAQGALRQGLVEPSAQVLSLMDARVGELYCSLCRFENGLAVERSAPWVVRPEQLSLPPGLASCIAVGDGLKFREQFPAAAKEKIVSEHEVVGPRAQDILPIARVMHQRGDQQTATEVCPVYVRDEISWKKLADQGKKA